MQRSWARYVATHQSVSGLFDTFNELRSAQKNPQGSIAERHRDLVRAAIVFTAAGMDTCLRTLMEDALGTLLSRDSKARGAFKGYVLDGNKRFGGNLTNTTKKAIAALDPQAELIGLYVQDTTAASIQSPSDLGRCRDALGLDSASLSDTKLRNHNDFFQARNEVAHELDLIEPSGKGTRGRRHRVVTAVGRQCDEALTLVAEFITATAKTVRSTQRPSH
ncbi:hypothetical protein FHX37_0073 [Haloactinospora alba]|uniref:RiboL-PSP-HEPN domain-containing protein n=1 Tax=Haloactinospora alba TaxID=405555 RepID=A0A543NEF3_9ACTN|nr:hypothetical protein FHX37_0073 [Haloactinospora alba]